MFLTQPQCAQFFDDGYVMVPDIFQPDELIPLMFEIDGLVDAAAGRLFDSGHITDIRSEYSFDKRMGLLVNDHPEFSKEYFAAIEGKAGGGHTGREMFNILTHPKLLDAISSLVGPEIIASSVYRIRPKLPGMSRGIVPWHQDSGYFEAHCDKSLIVTCWIPLVDATPDNGCLQVLPRAHRAGVIPHKTGGNAGFLVIEDGDLPEVDATAIDVPVPLGGALLMTNLTPHCSTANTSDQIRWSVDLRYQSADVPTNAFQGPSEFSLSVPEVNIACYPPEGDFVVRSAKNQSMVHDYETFCKRRLDYDLAEIPAPKRGWQPAVSVK